MLDHTPPATRRRLIVGLTLVAILILGFVAVGIYGLIAGPRTPQASGTATAPSAREPAPTRGSAELNPLPETGDGERFSRAVAEALFTWDTYSMRGLDEHRQVLLNFADPSGIETPGLIADLDRYFPTVEQWRALAEYQTTQHLDIDQVVIPEQWDDAVAASDGLLTDGYIAFTITGTRHRAGVWFGEPATMQEPVEFTTFLACPPATEHCHLLRLSRLGSALH